jgi:hypothetical protein
MTAPKMPDNAEIVRMDLKFVVLNGGACAHRMVNGTLSLPGDIFSQHLDMW